ncbi:MAG: hypothetical protein ACO1SX_14830 [Actinomycetota bacterium]
MQRRAVGYLAAVGALLVSGATATVGYELYQRRSAAVEARRADFIQRWSAELRSARTLAEAQRLPVYTRRFANGEWVAAVHAHACCSGGGFDATVLYDSRGELRADRSHRFCGVEALEAELEDLPARSLSEFRAGLRDRLRMQPSVWEHRGEFRQD